MEYNNELSYYTDVTTNKERVKPTVYYTSRRNNFEIGKSATITTVDHPAAYLNEFPIVYTSAVVAFDEETGEFETRNTLYKPFKGD